MEYSIPSCLPTKRRSEPGQRAMRSGWLNFTSGKTRADLYFGGGCVPAVARPAAEGDLPDWAKGIEIKMPLTDPKAAGQFVVSDPAVWKFAEDENGKVFLTLAYDRKTYKSTYTPKHRSPIHIALLKQYPLTDFALDVELMSTTEPYDHQDLCLFFGFQSPEKYYYVHL